MLKFINILRGILVATLISIVALLTSIMVCIILPFQWLFPKRHRVFFSKIANKVVYFMFEIAGSLIDLFLPTRWILDIPSELNKNHWYLLIANHRCGADILVLLKSFNKSTSLITFFLKRELLWQLPIAGIAANLLGYIFLIRHSKKDLRKNPHLKSKDIDTVKEACDKSKVTPRMIINFLEGTRFTTERHKRQKSPYQHLLKPKATGIALMINGMRDCLNGILDVTIIYSIPNPNIWKLISGQIKEIKIIATLIPISDSLIGDYYGDRKFRKQLQHYLNDLWAKKDQLLTLEHQREQS